MERGYIDIHTHFLAEANSSCYNLPIPVPEKLPEYYSIGLHPWFLEKYHDISILEPYCCKAFAIGEAGLDKLIDISLDQQIGIFERHIYLSERYKKPLIIHCVKAFNELIQLKKKHQPQQAWVVHGFNKKPQLAIQLIREGFYLSVGKTYNKESLAVIPLEKLFLETDDDVNFSIEKVYLQVAHALGMSPDILKERIQLNVQTIQTQ